MKNRSDMFFTESEKGSIEAAIRSAESGTSGEIVAMVVESSDTYRDIETIAGIIIAAVLSIIPSEILYINSDILLRKIFPSMAWFSQVPDGIRYVSGLSLFIVMTAVLYFPFSYIVSKLPAVKRYLIPASRIDAEVEERALRGFYEHGLSATRDATGVLFLISILERKVHVLADRGIYSKIKQETLDSYAVSIGKGIAAGRGCDALCAAIKEAGEELHKYFPRKSDDTNELSNRVITER